MISALSIAGYKCLRQVEIPLANLAVFVGANASGKSSAIQSLLLLRQSSDGSGFVDRLKLSGPLYEAGTAQDILHPESEHSLLFQISSHSGATEFKFFHDRSDEISRSRSLRSLAPAALISPLASACRDFFYLNAERIGPRVTYSLPPDEAQLSGYVGKHGEHTAAFLARASNGFMQRKEWGPSYAESFSEPIRILDGKNKAAEFANTSGRVDLLAKLVLGWILPGATFEVAENDQIDAASLHFIRDPEATRAKVRATHVGFGLSYCLPVIAAALAVPKGGVLIVENPEAHLHPFSQSRIGFFLAMISASGVQIVLETHSDHVLNGIRLAVRYKCLNAEDCCINYFSRPESSDTATVKTIHIDREGGLDAWPENFFDQIELDLSRL
jgi:predicted ATPase